MSKSQYEITRVVDNQEKWLSYKENLKRYNKAKASEFYFECLWILYAMIEDRTSSFLYYLGFTSSQKRHLVTNSKKIKKQVRGLLKISGNSKYKFDTLSGKLERIQSLLSLDFKEISEPTEYQEKVNRCIDKLRNTDEFTDTLVYLNNEWRDKRNQLTHSLFNKNPQNVSCELLSMVEKGYSSARILDRGVQQLKKEKIREKYKIK